MIEVFLEIFINYKEVEGKVFNCQMKYDLKFK